MISIHKPGEQEVMKVPMELHIHPLDSSVGWNWTLIYDLEEKRDVRSYELLPKDEVAGHYVIDEKNSIVLDAWRIDNTLTSRFEVAGNLLSIVYECRGEEMWVQIISGKNKTTPTGGSGDIPEVLNFPVGVIQRAVLHKD